MPSLGASGQILAPLDPSGAGRTVRRVIRSPSLALRVMRAASAVPGGLAAVCVAIAASWSPLALATADEQAPVTTLTPDVRLASASSAFAASGAVSAIDREAQPAHAPAPPGWPVPGERFTFRGVSPPEA